MIELQKIQYEVRQVRNTVRAEHCQRFFKTGKGEYGEGDIFLGIRVPELRRLSKKFKTASLERFDLIFFQ